jgi:stringent starvation protein B
MTSNRPYLIRAIHEWILDNGGTPYLLVNAGLDGVEVPSQHVKDGKIVLNISPSAVEGLRLGNEEIAFMARFSGVSRLVSLPVHAVLAVYSKENGRGMMFGEPDPDEPSPPSGPPPKPSLKVVK